MDRLEFRILMGTGSSPVLAGGFAAGAGLLVDGGDHAGNGTARFQNRTRRNPPGQPGPEPGRRAWPRGRPP